MSASLSLSSIVSQTQDEERNKIKSRRRWAADQTFQVRVAILTFDPSKFSYFGLNIKLSTLRGQKMVAGWTLSGHGGRWGEEWRRRRRRRTLERWVEARSPLLFSARSEERSSPSPRAPSPRSWRGLRMFFSSSILPSSEGHFLSWVDG